MAARAERWQRLGIEPGEERVLLAGAVTLFLVEWAAVSVTNVAETFFLKRVGVARLPIVFLVNSFLLAGTSVAVGRLAARADQRLLLMRALVLFGLLLLPLWLLVVARTTGAYAVLVVVAKQLDAIAVLVFWTALGGLVSGRHPRHDLRQLRLGAARAGVRHPDPAADRLAASWPRLPRHVLAPEAATRAGAPGAA